MSTGSEVACVSEREEVASKRLDPSNLEPLENRNKGISAATTRIFDIMTSLLLSKTENRDN